MKNETKEIQFTQTKKELADKYFPGCNSGVYAETNMAIISLLSDVQHVMGYGVQTQGELSHYNEILNDIKCVLCHAEDK